MGVGENAKVCVVCGANAVIDTDDPISVEFREGRYVVDGFRYERCSSCGEEFYGAGQVDAIHTAAADLARLERGLLAPEEVRSLRFDLDLTQTALDSALGASPGTVGRWERGSVVQPAVADRLMRLLWAHPELVAEVVQPIACESRGPYRPRSRTKD